MPIENIDFSMEKVLKDYPFSILPTVFNKRTGKAANCLFEEISPNVYENQARMITFHTSVDRIHAWIKCLDVFYYQYLGQSDKYNVKWHDEPEVWTDPHHQANSVVIDLLDNKDNFLYNVTFFVTTGTIRAQGKRFMDFVQSHFPIIKDILRKVVDVLDIADDSEATSSIEDLNNTVVDIDTTLVKDVDATLVKEVPAQTYPLPETPSTTCITPDPMVLLHTMEDTLTSAILRIEKSNANNAMNILKHIDALHQSLAQKSPKVHDQQSESESASLKAKLQSANDQLKSEKANSLYKAGQYEENQKQLQKLLSDTRHQLQQKILSSNAEYETLCEKLHKKDDEITFLSGRVESLTTHLNEAQDEIVSLKSHIASTTDQGERFQQPYGFQRHDAQPQVLLIGTSNINHINEYKLTTSAKVTKLIKYKLDETRDAVQNHNANPDVVVLHSLTNELKEKSPQNCVDALVDIVNIIQNKWMEAIIILSLCTPRFDSLTNQTNAQIINALLKQKFSGNVNKVRLCEHYNMLVQVEGNPEQDVIQSDNIHLTEKGVSMLAKNIKGAIHGALGIPIPVSRQSRSPSRRRRGRGGRGRGRGFANQD